MSTDERVLCIPTSHVLAVGDFQGFRPAGEVDRAALLDPKLFSFRPRSEVETDPAFKQLIPYVVLRCGPAVFHYRRGAGGGEARLRALRSVGIGGHVSDADAGADDPYRAGMLRELTEEVAIGGGSAERFLGFINDDSTPVGRVHLGVVHLFDLERPEVTPLEDGIGSAGFGLLTDLSRDREQFETWSRFVLTELT